MFTGVLPAPTPSCVSSSCRMITSRTNGHTNRRRSYEGLSNIHAKVRRRTDAQDRLLSSLRQSQPGRGVSSWAG
jgi:hypothetical protein